MNEVQQLERGRAKVWSAFLCCRKKLPELVSDPLLREVLTTSEKEGVTQTLAHSKRSLYCNVEHTVIVRRPDRGPSGNHSQRLSFGVSRFQSAMSLIS